MANTSVSRSQPAGNQIITSFPGHAFAITTSDTATYVDANATSVAVPVSVYVGTGGNIKITAFGDPDSAAVTFVNFPAGEMLPVQVNKVWATGTAATNLIGIS